MHDTVRKIICFRPAQQFKSNFLPSAHTTRNESPTSIPWYSSSSYRQHTWNCSADFPRASGADGGRVPAVCPAHKWRFPCNRPPRSLGIRRARSTHKLDKKINKLIQFYMLKCGRLLSQWMDSLSSKRFRHTLQNFRFCPCNGSDQQWATGFCGIKQQFQRGFPCGMVNTRTFIRLAAILEHGDTTVFKQRSCTTKLHTGTRREM